MAAEDYLPFDWIEELADEKPTQVIPVKQFKHETEKALLLGNDKGLFWLPKSQVDFNPETGVVYVPGWLKIKYFDAGE